MLKAIKPVMRTAIAVLLGSARGAAADSGGVRMHRNPRDEVGGQPVGSVQASLGTQRPSRLWSVPLILGRIKV